MRKKMRVELILLVMMSFASALVACGDEDVSQGWTIEEGDGAGTGYGSDTVVVATPGDPDSSVIVTGDPDRCVDIGADCIDLDKAKDDFGGKYCDEAGSQADVVVVEGEVVDVICYPPADEGTDIREAETDENGTVQVPQTESGSVVTFPAETDGAPIEGDIEIDAERTTIFGNGPDNTIIDGDLKLTSNNSRVRGLAVTGNVEFGENSNNSAISYCRIEDDLKVESNGFKAVNCQVFGDVEVTGNNAILTNIGVQGEWTVADGTVCNGCYSFEDANEDFLVQAGEIGDEIQCE